MTTEVSASTTRAVLDAGALAELRSRLDHTRLSGLAGVGWKRGAPSGWLQRLLADWRAFDPAWLQEWLDDLPQHRVRIDGRSVHVVHLAGRGPDPLPLLLTHGWPGSPLEYRALLPLLADPGAHGGAAADAFTVVVPCLPGFGFSDPPPQEGLTADAVARLWHALMTDGLGYHRYVAHGSDLGAGVTARLARAHPQTVAGIHLATPGLAATPAPGSPAEAAYAAAVQAWTAEEGGYAHEHATKPATLAAALADSPARLAAWIGEKIINWSAVTAGGEPAFPRRWLLATLTWYWATGAIGTSLLPYWAYRHTADAALPVDAPPTVPTAIDVFGGERVPFPKPPRELADRYYSINTWAEHPTGGHFPAVAEPELLARRLREAFRPLRTP